MLLCSVLPEGCIPCRSSLSCFLGHSILKGTLAKLFQIAMFPPIRQGLVMYLGHVVTIQGYQVQHRLTNSPEIMG